MAFRDFSQYERGSDWRAFVIAKPDHFGKLAFEVDSAVRHARNGDST